MLGRSTYMKAPLHKVIHSEKVIYAFWWKKFNVKLEHNDIQASKHRSIMVSCCSRLSTHLSWRENITWDSLLGERQKINNNNNTEMATLYMRNEVQIKSIIAIHAQVMCGIPMRSRYSFDLIENTSGNIFEFIDRNVRLWLLFAVCSMSCVLRWRLSCHDVYFRKLCSKEDRTKTGEWESERVGSETCAKCRTIA